jgi:endo-1,4-beta-xylanase
MKSKAPALFLLIIFFTGMLLGGTVRSGEETPGLYQPYMDYFPIGAGVEYWDLLNHRDFILKHFNSITAGNEMKFASIQPSEGVFAFFRADEMANFARKQKLLLRGHTLVWHQQYPSWLFVDGAGPASRELVLKRLADHINVVVPRYKDAVYCWDVVNEAVSDSLSEFLRQDSPWYKATGEDYIAEAFRLAHQADPNAKLFYNDYGTTETNKREKIHVLLEDLLDAGVPLHGMGMQAHWDITSPSVNELETAIRRYASLGLEVQITELDISLYSWNDKRRFIDDPEELKERLEMQAEQYRKVFAVFREYRDVVTGVTVWGLSDARTWKDNFPVRGRKDLPLMFDLDYKPKEAFWEVVNFAKP